MPSAIRTKSGIALWLGITVLLCLSIVTEARAATSRVYWGDFGGTTVGAVRPDGTESEPGLISGASYPSGIATSRTHVYWTNLSTNSISRAKLDGGEVEPGFIEGVEALALAISEGHLFWSDGNAHEIGRAKLGGGEVEPGFIEGVNSFYGLAADYEHLYWSDATDGEIGRANLDGSGLEPAFIKPAGSTIPYGVAVDPGHVYWANAGNDSIGRAEIDGEGIEEAFIPNAHPAGVAVDSKHVFWGHIGIGSDDTLGRAEIDGEDAEPDFVTGTGFPYGVATVPETTLTTSSSPGVVLGAGSIHADTLLYGAETPTGTIALSLFGPGDETCAGAPLATYPDAVSGNGHYESPPYTPTEAGEYRWRASYSGDGGNEPVTGPCGATIRVSPAPSRSAGDAGACPTIDTSAATFSPMRRPGKTVPGVRASVSVGAPSLAEVDGSISFELRGRPHTASLGSRSLQVTSTARLRLPLPRALRPTLPPGSRVKVSLRISATPDSPPGCASGLSVMHTFKARIVNVLR
jgi:virginiamycin B lyase